MLYISSSVTSHVNWSHKAACKKNALERIENVLLAIYFSGPKSRSIPACVTSQVPADFLASASVNLGGAFLYPVQACLTVMGASPQRSAASFAVIMSSNAFIVSPLFYDHTNQGYRDNYGCCY